MSSLEQDNPEPARSFKLIESSNVLLNPSSLLPELDDFLRNCDIACVTQASDHGTTLVIKAPRHEIQSVEGSVPIALRHELYEHPSAPVIRILTTIYDQPARPFALETFINVENPQNRADYEALSHQEELLLLFFDEEHQHRLTKQVGGLDRDRVAEILQRADELLQAIPEDQFSFEVAKAWVLGRTTL